MEKCLLFIDWHNTLSSQRFWEGQVSDEYLRFIDKDLFIHGEMLKSWMRGKYSSAEICHWLSMALGVPGPDLFEALQKSCEKFEILPEIVELLRKGKERLNIVLITDNMDCFSKWVVPRLKDLGIFSDIIVSCDVGRLKEDDQGNLFREILTKRNVEASQAYLIDDSPTACAYFEKMGGKAACVTAPSQTITQLQSLPLQF